MNRYQEIGDVLEGYADELEGFFYDDQTAHELDVTKKAAGHLQRAAALLLGLGVSEPLAAEVLALEAMCRCGKDLGEHGTEPPFPRHLEPSGLLVCDGFQAAASTCPPDAGHVTDVGELAGGRS